MLLNVRVLVLDGSSPFLNSNWMGSGAILDHFEEPSIALQSARICNLYRPTGWDISTLQASLPDDIICVVVSFSFHFMVSLID